MKRFWVLLGVVAVVGVAGLWYASRGGRGPDLANMETPPATDGFRGFTLGSDSAPVEVTEYSDFECPYCARFAAVQMPTIRAQLIETGRLRWRFRDFPLASHQYSRYASHAAHCAAEQGRFWEMHDQLFYNHGWAQTGRNPSGTFRDFARAVGLDVAAYDACMASGRHAGRIEASRREGDRLGVRETPSFYVDGQPFKGVISSDAFKRIVDSLIAQRR